MSDIDPSHQYPEGRQPNLDPSPFLSVIDGHGIYLSYDNDRNRSVLGYAHQSDYPLNLSPDNAGLAKVLLEPHSPNALLLPEDYVTLGQALNDAAGQVRTERGQVGARLLFGELGTDLSRIAQECHMVPRSISYLNVIYSREENGAKLLPPIAFIGFEPQFAEQAKVHVINTLRDSLEEGAINTAQKQLLYASFGGFIKTFDW